MLAVNPEKNTPHPDAEPVEVVDGQGRLLAVVSASEAHRQSLPHRAALVLFFSREGKLVLGKRPSSSAAYPGRFDLTTRGHLRPGEAALDAARRLVEEGRPGLGGLPVRQCLLAPSQTTGFEAVEVFRFRLMEAQGPMAGHGEPEALEALEVGREELAALAEDFRELFAPGVIEAFEAGMLFKSED